MEKKKNMKDERKWIKHKISFQIYCRSMGGRTGISIFFCFSFLSFLNLFFLNIGFAVHVFYLLDV